MTIQSPEEIVKELLEVHKTSNNALVVLDFTIRKVQQTTTLVEPNPVLSYLRVARRILHAKNMGKEAKEYNHNISNET